MVVAKPKMLTHALRAHVNMTLYAYGQLDNKTIGDDARELIISDLDPQILSPPVYKDFLLNYAEIKFN
jgi:hypothetical protein